MIFATGLSVAEDISQSFDDAWRQIEEKLAGVRPHLVYAFASSSHVKDLPTLSREIQKKVGDKGQVVGCLASGVIGRGEEKESSPSLSLWAAYLPGVEISTFHLDYSGEGEEFSGWEEKSNQVADSDTALLLADPRSFPADILLEKINRECPQSQVVGGMVSGVLHQSAPTLIWNGECPPSGAIMVTFQGNIEVSTVVSQGCRPVGHYFVITQADQNILLQLGGKKAFDQLREMIDTLDMAERNLIENQGLYLGICVDAAKEKVGRGDFVIRNVMGIHPASGAIIATDLVQPGQTIQFQVRDAQTAEEDLSQLLEEEKNQASYQGALLFSCNARGEKMFGRPHHDVQAVHQHLGEIPTAGFFAGGEIGPIGGKNFLHGYTASLALFREKDEVSGQ